MLLSTDYSVLGKKFFDILEEVILREDNKQQVEQSTKEKVNKSTRGMPRLSEAKKDAISCDKLRGLAHTNRSVDFRMGKPN